MTRLVSSVGYVFGIVAFVFRVAISLRGALFFIALAHMPANECPKSTRRTKWFYGVGMKNRDHRRARDFGSLVRGLNGKAWS